MEGGGKREEGEGEGRRDEGNNMAVLFIFFKPWKFQESLNEWLESFTAKLGTVNVSLKTQDYLRNKGTHFYMKFYMKFFPNNFHMVLGN